MVSPFFSSTSRSRSSPLARIRIFRCHHRLGSLPYTPPLYSPFHRKPGVCARPNWVLLVILPTIGLPTRFIGLPTRFLIHRKRGVSVQPILVSDDRLIFLSHVTFRTYLLTVSLSLSRPFCLALSVLLYRTSPVAPIDHVSSPETRCVTQ